MAKWQLITQCTWAGTEQYHDIEGDYENEDEAIEAFGGDDAAWVQVLEDHAPEYHVQKIEDTEE